MTLIDNILSLLKEQDYSFEELKAKTNASFFDLQSQIKVLLKEGKIHKHGFPTKYSLFEKKVSFRKEYLFKPLLAYREVFLVCYLALFLVFIYSVFFKNPFVFPGLEERAFLVSLPFLFISIMLYFPWKKLSEILPKSIIPKETLVFLDKFKDLRDNEDLKKFGKEFFEKIVYPYYPHFLIILSVTSLINISFLSLLNSFFTPIAIPLILVCIILIILKEKSFFNEKEFVKYVFLFLLILITLSSLKFEQITFITKPLLEIQFQLTITTIILGAITFYQNKQVIEQIEEEQTIEEKEEQKRAEEFDKKYPKLSKVPVLNFFSNKIYKEGIFYSIIFILCVGSFLGFGMIHLGQFMTADEPKWVNTRVPQLYEGLTEMDWGKTYINDKPGVLPAFLSGFVNFFLDHDEYKSQPLIYENYLFWWRLPILIFNFLMLFLIYHFSKILLGKNLALLSLILISSNPILIGISQIVNPDATLWSTAILCFLNFFLYLKTNKQKYLLYSSVFFGLALVSKYFVTFFYVLFFVILYLEYLINLKNKGQFFQRVLHLLKFCLVSMCIYFILFPATWINISLLIKGTIGANILLSGIPYFLIFLFLIFFEIIVLKNKLISKIRSYSLERILLPLIGLLILFVFILFLFNLFTNYSLSIPDVFSDNYDKYFLFFLSITQTFLSLTMPVLIGFLAVFFIVNKKGNKFETLFLLSLFLGIFLFIVGTILGGFAATTRYQIIIFPFYCVLAAMFFHKLFKNKKIIPLLLLIFSIFVLTITCPFYFQYSNELNIHNTIVTHMWGFGGYELAQITNNLDGARTLNIWDDYGTFMPFSISKTYFWNSINPFDSNIDIDYLVLTKAGEIKVNPIWNRLQIGRKDFFSFFGNNPLIKYYNEKNFLFRYCLNNECECIYLVKFDKNNFIE